MVAGAVHRARRGLGLPLAGEDQAVLRAGHRHVEETHALGGLHGARDAPRRGGSRGGSAEQPEPERSPARPPRPSGRGPPGLARLGQVDVGEIEPFAVWMVITWTASSAPSRVAPPGVGRFGDALAQPAYDASAVSPEPSSSAPHELAEEALEVGETIGPEEARGLVRLGRGTPAQTLRSSGRPGRSRNERARAARARPPPSGCGPAAHALQAGDVPRRIGAALAPPRQPPQLPRARRAPCRRAQVIRPGKPARATGEERRVGQADHRRAEQRHQRQVVVRVEHARTSAVASTTSRRR